jgi:hypothetical protein
MSELEKATSNGKNVLFALVSHPTADSTPLLALGINTVEQGTEDAHSTRDRPTLTFKPSCLPNPVTRCFCTVETLHD